MFNFNILQIIISVPITLIALTVHECAHGWVSGKLGDPTPKMQGRMTLNPLAHLDPVGTVLMVLTGFGWAKPVQINPMYYRDRVKGMALVALAGPLSNFLLAFIGVFLRILLEVIGMNVSLFRTITDLFVIRNLSFMVFNLIPFPPLDGFKIAGVIIPRETYYKILQYEHYIMYLLMFLSITGVFSNIIGNGVWFFYRTLFKGILNIFNLFI